jgi:NADPH:quinone reductase-like Zn-dependent oxidoreductase
MIGGGSVNDQGVIGIMARPLKAMLLGPFVSQQMSMMMAKISNKDLTFLADLMQSGRVTPVIDRTYNLAQTPEAIRYLEEGHARGKVILTVD